MTDRPNVRIRQFIGRGTESEDTLATLSPVSQAALRQFSLERTVAYGVDYGDAVELRGRVVGGQDWQSAADDLAQTCLSYAETTVVPTRVAYLRRASALLRMGQMMLLEDSDDRRATFTRAAELYNDAAFLCGDREKVTIKTADDDVLAGWWLSGGNSPRGAVIVIGGIEGWAMDFDSMGIALTERGLNVLLLDGPGQGESRFTYHHYLTTSWMRAYEQVVDYVAERSPDTPIGIIGNSMGGGLAMAFAAQDVRIKACCSNGGLVFPKLVPPSVGTFFTKMVAFCGTEDPDVSTAAWATVDPTVTGPNADYPLLVVHGGKDPMISDDLSNLLLDQAPTGDKQMVVFSDGDHCIYNHRQDRDILISDWMRTRLHSTSPEA